LQQLPEMGASQLALGNGRGRPRKAPHAPAEVQDHRSKKIGRPPKSETSQQKKAINSYWASMTPEERSKEMRRRQRVSAKRGGKMVGYGVNRHTVKGASPKRTLSPKSAQAVQATVEELRLKQRRERDAARHRANRIKEKAAAKAGEAKARMISNRKDAITEAEREAKQKIYVQRSLLKAQGVPESEWPPLPPKRLNSAQVDETVQ
jgi:hypothetical protein